MISIARSLHVHSNHLLQVFNKICFFLLFRVKGFLQKRLLTLSGGNIVLGTGFDHKGRKAGELIIFPHCILKSNCELSLLLLATLSYDQKIFPSLLDVYLRCMLLCPGKGKTRHAELYQAGN